MLNLTRSEFDVITLSVVEKFSSAKTAQEKKNVILGILRKGLTLALQAERKKYRMGLSGGHLTRDVCLCESTVTFYWPSLRGLEGKSYLRYSQLDPVMSQFLTISVPLAHCTCNYPCLRKTNN